MKKFKNVYSRPISTQAGLILPGKVGFLPNGCIDNLLKAKKIKIVENENVRKSKPRAGDAESSRRHSGSNVEKDIQGGRRSSLPQAGADKSTSDSKSKQTTKKRTSPKRPVVRKTSSVNPDGGLD